MSDLYAAYKTAHRHVTAERGPARNYDCVDCGQPSHDWSLRHDADPSTVRTVTDQGRDWTFSTDIRSYEARCRRCHKIYDGGWDRAPNGQLIRRT